MFPQALKILDNLWCAVNETVKDFEMRCAWQLFLADMEGRWSPKLLQVLLLLSAMISCRVPVSAYKWARERFIPVRIHYLTISVIGLLSKHAPPPQKGTLRTMLSVGRHIGGGSLGKDLVLADIDGKVAIGLIPDFLYYARTDDDFVTKASILYKGLIVASTSSDCTIRHVPLNAAYQSD